ncbi:MAG: group II intron reverse transcriptase/maturase [Prevotellaceae bacterium]|jgi:group II intron reverse transcriptase/maturase|nr:group II intron reverse transcriptase/maturase [Prevotellaceae bacterium]
MKTELNIYQKRVEGMTYLDKRMLNHRDRTHLLQANLNRKAKEEKGYVFYVLYDKVFLPYILRYAWDEVRKNGGSAGVDGETVQDVSGGDVDAYLDALSEDLRRQTYKPSAVKRVWIPKSNGEKRPLGIPTVRDRIVQAACKLIIEPIFEADFEESSYGFRPERSAGDAIRAIRASLQAGNTTVYDADLSKYFDTIPHGKLLQVLKKRISDPRVLRLIKLWLKAPVSDRGNLTGGKRNKVGTPQGCVISPLLANIYMNLIDKAVNRLRGYFQPYGIKIIRYADDFILTGRDIGQHTVSCLKHLLARTGLRINETKTKLLNARTAEFNFLGFTFRYDASLYGTGQYLNIHPGKKALGKIKEKIHEYLHTHGHSRAETVSAGLNMIIKGWLNYFDLPGCSYTQMTRRHLRWYMSEQLYRYYRRKSQRRSSLYGQQAYEILISKYGLVDVLKYRPPTQF